MKLVISALVLSAIVCAPGLADENGSGATAMYLANAGVLVTQGDTKVLFDPLYRLNHGYYLSLPEAMENDLLVGEPPFDGVDAVFVSHFHLDHFSPNQLLNYLMINTEVRLFAPEQAVLALQRFTTEEDEELLERIVSLNLSSYGEPVTHEVDGLVVESVRVPHSGWPDANRGTQNLVFRVTLDDTTTVVHLGDAAAQTDLFERFTDHWGEKHQDLVMAPYWFFQESDGRKILQKLLRATESVGIHVPAEVPAEPHLRPSELRELNIFTRPGETRSIKNSR